MYARQDNERPDDFEGGYENVLRSVVRELRDVEKVGYDARDHFPCTRFVEERERELLHMLEQVAPHVRFNASAENMTPRRNEIERAGFNEIEDEHQDR